MTLLSEGLHQIDSLVNLTSFGSFTSFRNARNIRMKTSGPGRVAQHNSCLAYLLFKALSKNSLSIVIVYGSFYKHDFL